MSGNQGYFYLVLGQRKSFWFPALCQLFLTRLPVMQVMELQHFLISYHCLVSLSMVPMSKRRVPRAVNALKQTALQVLFPHTWQLTF